MAIAINSNFERDQLVATAGQTIFPYSFPIFDETYIKVYQRGGLTPPDDDNQLLTLGVDYSVQGVGQETGGTITLTVPALNGDILTLVGAEPIERQSVFQDLNPFTVALNQQLNEQTVMQQQTYTYWANITPHYNFDELVSAPGTSPVVTPGVRPHKLILPMLAPGETWVGRGNIGDPLDDIITQSISGAGMGNVVAAGPGMRPSITQWTGTDFIITDSDIHINGAIFERTATGATEDRTGFADAWGAMHWPAHITGGRPVAPANGDTYYDTTLNQFFGYEGGVWQPFAMGGAASTTTFTFVQTPVSPETTLFLGSAVRMDVGTGLWTLTLADNSLDAEFYGVIVGISGGGPAFTYTLQLVGVAPTGIPALTGLVAGSPYYLSDTVLGGIQITPPAGSGKINYPIIWAVDATTVFIRMSRGFINGGTSPTPPGPAIPPVKVIITPGGPPLAVGDWLYISADNVFTKGIATSLATSQVEWVVTDIITPATTYAIQQIGQITGVVTADDLGNPITSSTIYYLSRTVAGALTAVAPVTPGFISKPLYVQQILASNTGWIMDQRPDTIPTGGGGSGTGAIVQSKSATIRSAFNFPAGTATVPGQSITITPTAATSNMLISVHCGGMNSAGQQGFRILRDGVVIAGATGSAPGSATVNATAGSTLHGAAAQYNDPAVAAIATTYAIQAYTLGNPGVYNYGALGGDNVISTITVQEVL